MNIILGIIVLIGLISLFFYSAHLLGKEIGKLMFLIYKSQNRDK